MTVDGFEVVKEVSVVQGKGLYSVVTNEVRTVSTRTLHHCSVNNTICLPLNLLDLLFLFLLTTIVTV